jgi:hypothetical protein
MSIKGYPVAASPAIARAATGSTSSVCPWPSSGATAGQRAGKRWGATGRSWPNCVTGGPPSAGIAESSPLSEGALLLEEFPLAFLFFGVMPSFDSRLSPLEWGR